MTTAASHEVVWTNQNLAEQIDSRLLDIAQTLPQHAFLGGAGEPVPVHVEDGVGQLHCTNVGKYTIRITAQLDGYDGNVGFWKDYALSHPRKQKSTTPFRVDEKCLTSPAELDDCPVELEVLADGLKAIHDGFRSSRQRQNQHSAQVIRLFNKLAT